MLLGTFIVTLPAWAGHRYHYLLSSGAPGSGAIAPANFTLYWESDTLIFPTGPACAVPINAESLPNFTATISNPLFTLVSVNLCNRYSNYPLAVDIAWMYQGEQAGFEFYSKGKPGVETDKNDAIFTVSSGFVFLDVYNATLSITDTWAAPMPPVPVCALCILRVFITAGPVVPAPGTPVEATVGLTDLSGTPIGSPQGVAIIPGHVTTVEFAPTALVSAAATISTHQDVIPVVTLVNAPSSSPPIQVTAETSVLGGLGGLLTSAGVSVPPLTLAPQSIRAGQVMRMIAMANSPNQCTATLGFASANGAPVGPGVFINLSPGQAQTLDLDASTLSLQLGQRAVLQPTVLLITAAQPNAAAIVGPMTSVCAVTSEVFDTLTGLTLTYQNAFLE
ncbi:MAG TPA: hypothetical protein VEV17_26725 [Bryobacteraceae bacterium]|nr:hypothetical protein [Bryobacteraceae bacterium]